MLNCICFANIKFKKFNYRIKYMKERDLNLDIMIKYSEKIIIKHAGKNSKKLIIIIINNNNLNIFTYSSDNKIAKN